MKRTTIITLLFTGLLVGLFYLGGFWLAVGLATLATTAIIFSAFALGSMWTARTMQAGANIAIKAQAVNDQYDAIKAKSFADFGREIARLKQDSPQAAPQYPALPPAWVDGSFSIAGLDAEREEVER